MWNDQYFPKLSFPCIKIGIICFKPKYSNFQPVFTFAHFKNFDPPHIAASPGFPPRHLSSGQPLRCIVFQWHKLCKFPAFTSKIALIGHSGVGNEPVALSPPGESQLLKDLIEMQKMTVSKIKQLIDLGLVSLPAKNRQKHYILFQMY